MNKDENLINGEDEITSDDITIENTDETEDESNLKDKIKELRKKLKEKEEEAKKSLDGWQRARAEMVNKDKQIQSERVEIFKQAAANILEDLIPVLDSYEMARKNKIAWENVEQNWRMGIEYIFAQLQSVVDNNGLKKLEPILGEEFNVNNMHAIEEVETEDETKDHTVSEVIQSGYELNGKLLRESKVKIYIFKNKNN